MPGPIKNILLSQMNADGYDNDNRQHTLDKISEFMNSEAHTSILSTCLKQCGLSVGNITKLMGVITSGLQLQPKLLKTLDKDGRRYLIFAILYQFIVDECPQFFETLALGEFTLLFNGAINLLMVDPKNIAKVKASICC